MDNASGKAKTISVRRRMEPDKHRGSNSTERARSVPGSGQDTLGTDWFDTSLTPEHLKPKRAGFTEVILDVEPEVNRNRDGKEVVERDPVMAIHKPIQPWRAYLIGEEDDV